VYRWELDGLAQQEFADLPRAARGSLAAFTDAVVVADPVQYQRRCDERDDVSMPLRSLHFGPDGGGLVRFLSLAALCHRARECADRPEGGNVL
jgi:hypothetical protein